MNPRLLTYLRSLGLATDANDDQALEFHQGLKGIQASIANALNYAEADQQARTNCDLMIRALGYDPVDPSNLLVAEITTTVERTEPAPTQPAGDGSSAIGDLEVARAEGVQLENQRVAAIRELAELSGTPDELVRTLVTDPQITIETARQRLLEDHRQRTRGSVTPDVPAAGPAIHRRNSQSDFDRNSLAAALMLRHTDDPLVAWPSYNPTIGSIRRSDQSQNTEIARAVDRGHELRGLSLIDMVWRALQVDGIQCERTVASIEHAIQSRGGAAMSTSALSGIFTSSINAQLLSGYESAPDSTEGWTSTVDVADYKTNDRHRLEKGGQLVKRPRGGTAEHGEQSEASESYKVREYAKQFVIDRQDLINDTFGALQDYTPSDMGAAAAELRADLVYAILLANANMRDSVALFHATHSNLKTSSALTVANLEVARAAIQIQQENSRNLNLMPTHLVVPGQLQSTAETLIESSVVVSGNTTPRGANNSNARAGLSVSADARLDNGVTDPDSGTTYSGSASTWFLAAASAHTIEVGYIRQLGRNPQVRSFILDRGQFGIGFDVSHSVGAKALDWRGLLKATA